MQGKRIGMGRSHALVMLAAMLLIGCSESSMSPLEGPVQVPPGGGTQAPPLSLGHDVPGPLPELGSCGNLALPRPSKLFSHVHATGDQIYRWTGSAWVLAGPSATLYHDAALTKKAGTHYVGPTWETTNGSRVYGSVVDRCTPNVAAIPWLLLRADSAKGPAFYKHTTFIHRVNTVGGNAPSTAGTVVGELVNVPYRTEYYFYRDK